MPGFPLSSEIYKKYISYIYLCRRIRSYVRTPALIRSSQEEKKTDKTPFISTLDFRRTTKYYSGFSGRVDNTTYWSGWRREAKRERKKENGFCSFGTLRLDCAALFISPSWSTTMMMIPEKTQHLHYCTAYMSSTLSCKNIIHISHPSL